MRNRPHPAIDSAKPLSSNQLHAALELTLERFFASLYVERTEFEEEIMGHIEKDVHALFVIGPAGCGRTSLVSKILNELESEGSPTRSSPRPRQPGHPGWNSRPARAGAPPSNPRAAATGAGGDPAPDPPDSENVRYRSPRKSY